MIAEATSVGYCVQMTVRQTQRLIAKDSQKVDAWFKDINIRDVNYNGHFGPNFFFTTDFDGHQATAEKVMQILQRKLKGTSS